MGLLPEIHNSSKFCVFLGRNFGPESSISGSKVQAQGLAIPKCPPSNLFSLQSDDTYSGFTSLYLYFLCCQCEEDPEIQAKISLSWGRIWSKTQHSMPANKGCEATACTVINSNVPAKNKIWFLILKYLGSENTLHRIPTIHISVLVLDLWPWPYIKENRETVVVTYIIYVWKYFTVNMIVLLYFI